MTTNWYEFMYKFIYMRSYIYEFQPDICLCLALRAEEHTRVLNLKVCT